MEEVAELIPFLQDLVRIHTVNGRDDELEVAKRIQEEARKLDIDCHLYSSPETPNRPNVVASVGTGEPLFLFVAHSDTVSEGSFNDWQSPPFDANIVEDKMIGRGTADNKAGIAVALYTLHFLKKTGVLADGKGKVLLAAVADEESGACSDHGLAYLLRDNKFTDEKVGSHPQGAIYCHIGSRVTIGHRGLIRLLISVRGQAVHSGVHEWCTGEKGSNASMALCNALVNIENHEWPLALHAAFPKLRFTITPGTVLKGGEYESMVPPYAESLIDIRTMPGQNQDDIIRQITSIVGEVITNRNNKILAVHNPQIDQNPQLLSFKVTVKNKLPSAHISPDHPLSQACVEAVREILGENVACEGCGPANEGYMLMDAGIPTICGFGYKGGHPHAPNEWVSVTSLVETVKVYSSVVRKYCGI